MSVPIRTPSTRKSTFVTPTLSDAVAEIVTVPLTVDPMVVSLARHFLQDYELGAARGEEIQRLAEQIQETVEQATENLPRKV